MRGRRQTLKEGRGYWKHAHNLYRRKTGTWTPQLLSSHTGRYSIVPLLSFSIYCPSLTLTLLFHYTLNQTTRYSKRMAEETAWNYVKEHQGFDLVSINPSFIVGPPLNKRYVPKLAFFFCSPLFCLLFHLSFSFIFFFSFILTITK